jgi:hypothetical protein
MPDVSLMVQSGWTPKKEWIERHFRVELEDKKEAASSQQEDVTKSDPDEDLYEEIFGADAEAPQEEAPKPFESDDSTGDQDITEDEAVSMADK